MKPMAVFYHAWIPSSDRIAVVREQLTALNDSGLTDAAAEIHIGVNQDCLFGVIDLFPSKATVHAYKDLHQGEMPTMLTLQEWVPGHSGWNVCYHHTKGISQANDSKAVARHCMTEGVIANWRRCIADLDSGCDAVGCHWLYWPKNSVPREHRLFGGNFWWAKQEYLAQLPPLRLKVHESGRFFEGEIWIGRREQMPVTKDYHPEGRPCAL